MRYFFSLAILLLAVSMTVLPDDHGDSPLVATPVPVGGGPLEACVDVPGDLDYFLFAATSGRTYRILSSHMSGGMDSVLYLFDSDGRSILAVDDNSGTAGGSQIEWTAPRDGVFFFLVRHALATSGTGCYAVSVSAIQVDDHGNTPLTATPLAVGTAGKAGFLETSGDTDVFLFQAEIGYAYVLAVQRTSGRGAFQAVLLSGNGATHEEARIEVESEGELRWTAPATGTFFLEISRNAGDDPLGYDVRVSRSGYADDHANMPEDATMLETWGASLSGSIEVASDEDWFRFDATQNGEYTVTLSPEAEGRYRVLLVGADGVTLLDRQASSSGADVRLDWVAPNEGTYYLVVSASGAVGEYSLAIDTTLQLSALGSINPQGYSLDVEVAEGYAYLVVGTKGLLIVDVHDPARPFEVGSNSTRGYAQAVTLSGHYAYVANRGDGLTVVDVSDPMRPVEVGHLDTEGSAQAVFVQDHVAFVADQRGGLHLIDVGRPEEPSMIGSIVTRGFAQAVWVDDSVAYVALGDAGLELIDVSDPAAPESLGRVDLPGDAGDVVARDGVAYVAAGYRGVRILDVHDGAGPRELGFISTAGEALGIALSGTDVYVAEGGQGFSIYDIRDTQDPKRLAQFDTPGEALRVCVEQDKAYIADREAGLHIIQLLP